MLCHYPLSLKARARERLDYSLPDVARVQGDAMLGEATRRQFSLTLDRVMAIAADNTALE